MPLMIFHGDSITDCGRALPLGSAGFQDHKLGPGYPSMVAAELLWRQPEKDWNFFNYGVSGSSISGVFCRWGESLSRKPDIISVLIGVNDAHYDVAYKDFRYPVTYEDTYRMLLKWGRDVNPAIKYILIEPFIQEDGSVPSARAEKTFEKAAAVRKLASEFGAVSVPMQEIFDQASVSVPKTHWSTDTVHLTLAGHRLLAASLIKSFLEG